MKNTYFAISVAIIAIMFVAIGIQNVHAQVNQSLSNSTVAAILNQFNPANQAISTTSYVPPSGCPMPTSINASGAINKIQCGLYEYDPLNNDTKTQEQLANSTYWVYGGDAPAENAPYSYYQDTQGLHIGVQAPASGTYAGYYAVTPNSNAMLFHAVLTTPVRTVPYGDFQNGLYVQTTQAPVNYVTCVSITDDIGTVWALVHTYGSPYGSLVFDTLWVDTSADQPLTRDCTIITNGHNYLKLYVDNALVYSSNTLALGMPAPFNAFLEPQTSYDGAQLFGTYNDFYSALSENVKVINNPPSAAVAQIVDSSGNLLASAPVILGNATIDIGRYHLPATGNIQVLDSSNVSLASSPVTQSVYGGDVYSVVTSNGNTMPLH